MAELADALDSKSSDRKIVWVRSPPPAFSRHPCLRGEIGCYPEKPYLASSRTRTHRFTFYSSTICQQLLLLVTSWWSVSVFAKSSSARHVGVALRLSVGIYCRAHWTGHLESALVGTKGSRTVIWEVVCPVHGSHQIRQKSEPIICKIKVQLSPRYVRQRRKRLTSAVQCHRKK